MKARVKAPILEALAKLRACICCQGGSVTAGNSSQMSDGAAFCYGYE